ncbi:hypothetical protein Dimus_035187 [Dionaea muscipula]
MVHLKWDANWQLVMGFLVVFLVSISAGYTDPRDVFAINRLYAALGSPALQGWVQMGGDPCMEAWQGVLCVNSNITGLSLNGANLQGELGTDLDSFTAMIGIDLTDNHIGGSIPSNLPSTIRTFYLSGNQFTGSIPQSLSTLTQLTDLSLSNNNLTGEIPDAFQELSGMVNSDLSSNHLNGPLPPSMGNLSSLTRLHLQDNKISGTLNVLENLPLIDLNIENNQFSGPIPPRLLTIPNFRSYGNPFNTSILPSPPAEAPDFRSSSPLPSVPPPHESLKHEKGAPSHPLKTLSTKRTIWSAIAVGVTLVLIVLGLWLYISRSCKRRQKDERLIPTHEKTGYEENGGKLKYIESLPQTYRETNKVMNTSVKKRDGSKVEQNQKKEADVKGVVEVSSLKNHHHAIDLRTEVESISAKKVSVKPIMERERGAANPSTISKSPELPKSFTVASLQEYTHSFSQENLVGEGILGSIYRAELPDGMLVAVKKLNTAASRSQSDAEFVQLVYTISKYQHENVVKLIGYCSEYKQRLLIYEYCINGTLYDALHYDEEIHNKLSWDRRIKIALGAARALEYLHEGCWPPVMHKSFKSANILFYDNFEPRVSDCGLVTMFSDGSASQLVGTGYDAPELELGSYTQQSDAFSFGVVMLELLTGRKPFDRSRPRGEQLLVRWAIPRLHDINALSKMVDPSLNGAYPSKSLSRFADIISLCIQAEPGFRPPMSEIVNLLKLFQRESSPEQQNVI